MQKKTFLMHQLVVVEGLSIFIFHVMQLQLHLLIYNSTLKKLLQNHAKYE